KGVFGGGREVAHAAAYAAERLNRLPLRRVRQHRQVNSLDCQGIGRVKAGRRCAGVQDEVDDRPGGSDVGQQNTYQHPWPRVLVGRIVVAWDHNRSLWRSVAMYSIHSDGRSQPAARSRWANAISSRSWSMISPFLTATN